jgi:predicted AlkP superfamily pyrophosphatase or phosphodiesterase
MRKSLLLFLLLIVIGGSAQTLSRPKLVVGIVVDQMRWDYLYRFYDRYGTGGFKRLLGEGFSCENTFVPYTPTYTAPGHTCVYTGSVPSLHGIVGNNWYDRSTKQIVYCTDDTTVKSVGSTSDAGQMSPRNMWATTVTDELRLATNFKGKTIGIALKDRGAILPAGHAANAAYWFDDATGGWISSTYYMQTLPQWVQQLNAKHLPDEYMAKSWKTIFPLDTYTQSTADNKPYEGGFPGGGVTFEHRTDTIKAGAGRYAAFRVTPYGNTFTVDAAKAAIDGEGLGMRGVTDFLAVSFSSTDYIGHTFGPNSVEVEDTYLRLDKDLADLLNYLDFRVGKGAYLLFLTADHAVAHTPGFAQENKIPAGISNPMAMQKVLNDALQKEFGNGNYIETIINYQVFLNNDFIQSKKLNREAIKRNVIQTLLTQPGVDKAVDLENLRSASLPQQVETSLVNGYNQKLSGDIQYIYRPQWFEGFARGTTHGSWNPYDSHIPLLWYGWGIKTGKSHREVYMTDIAPTVAALLEIQMPNASIGKVIDEVQK